VNRVVITGLGAVTPLGHTAREYWRNLSEGVSGLGPLTLPAESETLTQKVAAEVKGFDPMQHFEERVIPQLDRVSQFAVVAAREAIAQSGIKFDMALSVRTAAIIGTGVGGQTTHDDSFRRIYKENRPRAYPLTIPKLMANAPASQISMHCGLRGPAFAVASACASATHAIGLAFHMVRSGAVDCAVTGGTEACLTYGTVRGWEALRVMAPDMCRPFSADRKGMVLGEGAAMLVLEPLDMISVPRGENRSFRNVSSETARLLVMIVPESNEKSDPISYAPSLAKEIENDYGKGALEGLQKIGFKFEDEPAS